MLIISRIGDITHPYKRAFTCRIKSVINYLPRCSYNVLYLDLPGNMKINQAFKDLWDKKFKTKCTECTSIFSSFPEIYTCENCKGRGIAREGVRGAATFKGRKLPKCLLLK